MQEQVIIFLALFCLIGFIIKVVSDNKLRRRIIEKGEIDANVKDLFTHSKQQVKFRSLKWGIILVAVGLGLIIGSIFSSEEIAFAFMLIFAGFALILYYHFGDKINKKEESAE